MLCALRVQVEVKHEPLYKTIFQEPLATLRKANASEVNDDVCPVHMQCGVCVCGGVPTLQLTAARVLFAACCRCRR